MKLLDTVIRRRDGRVEMMLDRMRAVWNEYGDSLPEQRAAFHAVSELFPEPEAVVENTIEVGGVPAIEAIPATGIESGAPVLLYLHGGAFLIGSAEIYREQSARISTVAGARVITLDYRLAPEHVFPGAIDDVATAYQHLLDSGVSAGQIVIGGDSAGGNLAMAATMRLRDQSAAIPAGLVLVSPWVDLTCSGLTMETNANPRHLAQKQGLLRCAKTYLAGADPNQPDASPLFGDLSDLPPSLIQVGSLETLLDDSLELERSLTEAGNQVQLRVYEGMVHEWHLLSALLPPDDALPESHEAIGEISAFIRSIDSP